VKILAIESATEICGVAYREQGKCQALIEAATPRRHAEQLPLFYQELTKKNGMELSQLDAIAVSIGPGSFTGLRIGLSYAKGLAYSHDLPIVPVPTLQAMAHGIGEDTQSLVILIRSHRSTVFTQKFHWENHRVQPAGRPEAREWADVIAGLEDGYSLYHWGCDDLIQEQSAPDHPTLSGCAPSARWIAALADIHFQEWVKYDPKQLEPDYISPFISGKTISDDHSQRNP
jgi:tRNA threonylcarbamoyladenosine biosynthesis protein TsaB